MGHFSEGSSPITEEEVVVVVVGVGSVNHCQCNHFPNLSRVRANAILNTWGGVYNAKKV